MRVEVFRVACGEFIGVSDVEKEDLEKSGLAVAPEGIHRGEGMFAARARGTSMAPRIKNGDWCVFVPDLGGTRENRIVLVEDQSQIGMERYTLKKYQSTKTHFPDGTWAHDQITLIPLNGSEHKPIQLNREDNYQIRGWFVDSVRQIQYVEKYRYESVPDEI